MYHVYVTGTSIAVFSSIQTWDRYLVFDNLKVGNAKSTSSIGANCANQIISMHCDSNALFDF